MKDVDPCGCEAEVKRDRIFYAKETSSERTSSVKPDDETLEPQPTIAPASSIGRTYYTTHGQDDWAL